MKKKRHLTKKGKVIFLVIPLLITILVCYFTLLDHRIRGIYIKGNNILTDSEVIELASIENYPNFYTTSRSKIKKNLKKNPYVKDVKISKKFFHEIHIQITEYRPLFVYAETGNIVLETKEEVSNDKKLILPVLINYVPKDKYTNLISKLNKIEETILNKVSEIKYDPNEYDEDRFLLYMNDENYVYITLTKIDLLNKYDKTVTKLNGKKGILYLDSGNYFEIK